ncbi:hypothetical protein FHL15_010078 [Xylaria flabelliformis]|uniref:Uncharacterized protein n=1 Tax=Xylaria flabelliformis TaxID=2512241 RepID=A0A553HM74_9PEZI|nr:hypothetical protein FHL15_010078 [Xylaria flabelliformis]
MPPLTATPLVNHLIGRDTIFDASNTTTTQPAVQVVCAWAVSGQYGFGTRLLVDTAVDMDIYGAFQICSIGILAAPITVYNSKTYFNDPGRNIIFIWTGLLLAGMLSLAVEFFRTETHRCSFDDMGAPIDPFNFPYMSADCDLHCFSNSSGPFSPIRQDPTNEPAVIPAPTRLAFSTVILLAAASSIPPVLTLIFTWEKILEINWKRRFARGEVNNNNDPIEGTNGATPKMINFINDAIRRFLTSIQIPIFGAIVIAILVAGELNFWSPQVNYQTEPFTSVGQWANVVATALVVLGSLSFVQDKREINGEEGISSSHSHNSKSPAPDHTPHSNRDHESISPSIPRTPSVMATDHVMDSSSIRRDTPEIAQPDEPSRDSIELTTIITSGNHEPVPLSISNKHRNNVATLLNKFGEYLGTPAPDRYDNSIFEEGKTEFPEIPGEAGRVAGFEDLRDWYRNTHQQEDGGSVIPGLSRVESSSSFRMLDRDTSPSRAPRSPSRSSTTPVEQSEYPSPELGRVTTSPPVAGPSRRTRRDTLEVPSRPRPTHFHFQHDSTPHTHSSTTVLDTEGSPKIVVSAEPEESSPNTPTMHGASFGPP